MAVGKNQDKLEAARARLESALSRLTQGVASTRDTIASAGVIAEEKIELATRITALERENLKLHEQVATYALQSGGTAESDTSGALKAEKEALERNYQLLKRQYAHLQDELEAAENAKSPTAATDESLIKEIAQLKAVVLELEADRDITRQELDAAIAKLETMVENA